MSTNLLIINLSNNTINPPVLRINVYFNETYQIVTRTGTPRPPKPSKAG